MLSSGVDYPLTFSTLWVRNQESGSNFYNSPFIKSSSLKNKMITEIKLLIKVSENFGCLGKFFSNSLLLL